MLQNWILPIITIGLIVALWGFGEAYGEDCSDGTWVYHQQSEDFVCVEDDGVYTPPMECEVESCE